MIIPSTDDRGTTIILRPNASLTWQQSKIMIAFIVTCSMLIAAYCAFHGAWMVLPFAGLESGLFGLCIYLVCLYQQRRQVIRIESGMIEIAQGVKAPEQVQRWSIDNVTLSRVPGQRASMPPTLTLKAPDGRIELGGFLNKRDKKVLYKLLSEAGISTRPLPALFERHC